MSLTAAIARPDYLQNKKQQVKTVDNYTAWKRNNCNENFFDYVVGLAEENGNNIRSNKPIKHPTTLYGFEKKLYFEVLENIKKNIAHNKYIDEMIEKTDDYNEKMEIADHYRCAVRLYEL